MVTVLFSHQLECTELCSQGSQGATLLCYYDQILNGQSISSHNIKVHFYLRTRWPSLVNAVAPLFYSIPKQGIKRNEHCKSLFTIQQVRMQMPKSALHFYTFLNEKGGQD